MFWLKVCVYEGEGRVRRSRGRRGKGRRWKGRYDQITTAGNRLGGSWREVLGDVLYLDLRSGYLEKVNCLVYHNDLSTVLMY